MEDSGFERIIDDEESTGELFKDAYLEEAIIDQVRAVEFEMETTGSTKVGSLINEVSETEASFERIADDDESADSEEPTPAGKRREQEGEKQIPAPVKRKNHSRTCY